jgi:lipopolysaccharide/colanic/teichoic acid biosynthesis glycosyltransferase
MHGAPILVERASIALLMTRIVDLLVVALVAPIFGPILLLLTLVIRADSPGPAFAFIQRLGRGGAPFRLIKLRSMVANAAKLRRELEARNALSWPDFKIRNDPRITRVGRWLRRFSLDEFPQLWNVLRGDVTLIGPRPCSVPLSDYALWQTERLEATPGLVGSWQAQGRGSVDWDTRCRMDISQIRTRSFYLMLRYVITTLWAVLTARGAD